MKKKVIARILAGAMLLSVLGTAIFANAETTTSNGTNPSSVTIEVNGNKVNLEKTENFIKGMFENEAFKRAFDDYKTILSKVSIGSEYVPTSVGTKFEEFEKMAILKEKPTEMNLGDNAIAKLYRYTTKEAFNTAANQDPGTADLIMVYKDNKLVYVGIQNNSFNFKEANLLKQDVVKELTKEKFDFEKLQVESPIVTGIGTTKVNDNQYSVISMVSGKAQNPVVEYFAITQGKLDYITSKGMSEAMDKGLILNIQSIKDYIENDSTEFYKLKPTSNTH